MRIAVIGDVHQVWGPRDNAFFGASDYAAVLFVGDLPGYAHQGLLATAARIAGVGKPAVMMLGNHDGPSLLQVWLEGVRLAGAGWEKGLDASVEALRLALGPVTLGGYSHHRFGDVSVVLGRPHAMDGRTFPFHERIARRYGVSSMAQSAARLCALVDEATPGPLILMGHNGPKGLGSVPTAPFALGPVDLGDPDLAEAALYARKTRSGPIVVVAGHVHRHPMRAAIVTQDGLTYVNAAVVPRVRRGRAHHVSLSLREDQWFAEDVWV